MDKQKVFVSFDYENDKHYKYLLEAWDENSQFEFVFDDKTPEEINSENIGRIKAVLSQKIKEATHTLVIVGKYANTIDPKSNLIGDINWINWEINKSKEYKKKLVGIKIDRECGSPKALLGSEASWAMSFTQESIIRALKEA